MIQTIRLSPSVTLRCCQDLRFRQGCLSLQFLRPMTAHEAAMNALLPSVLLRGTERHPDLRAITLHLDDLYGAAVGPLVRRIGDRHTTGLYCSFIDDRFALSGDQILAPMVDFLRELMQRPIVEEGGFCREFVESEKKNLISEIESELNDKRAYAATRLLRAMCQADSFGIPRLGDKASIAKINAKALYAHYRKILRESPVELFYVGSAAPETVAGLLMPLFSIPERFPLSLPDQTPFRDSGSQTLQEEMDIIQSQLCMGFVTPITNRCSEFAAMQVLSHLFGGGMTSKLFLNVREKMSLCYSIGSGYYGAKGILTVSAGIDADKEETVRSEILAQLEACRQGDISEEELRAAREAIVSSLRSVHDSPGAIEGFYSTSILSGLPLSVEGYRRAVETVSLDAVAAAASTLRLHTTYFLKGVSVCS